MEERHKKLLTDNTVYLVKNLYMPDLIDHMIQTRLLNDDDGEKLKVTEFISLFSILFDKHS